MTSGWDAIVLAGGASRRMGGVDKVQLDIDGRPLIDRVLAATARATSTIVVGPQRAVSRPVQWCLESPAGGGPVAALAAGLRLATSPHVVLLAADQPFVTDDLVDGLVGAVGENDGAVAVDGDGQPQWMCSAWRTEVLRTVALPVNASLRHTLGGVQWRPFVAPARSVFDCDTPDDLTQARQWAG